MPETECTFCLISEWKEEAAVIHQNEHYMAFMDIYPAVPGQTVVVPKKHNPSYIFKMDEKDYSLLMDYSRFIARVLDAALGNGRTALVIEGTHVEHPHVKLYPLAGTVENWKKYEAPETELAETYEGFITTKQGHRAKKEYLVEMQYRINRALSGMGEESNG